MKIKLAHIDYSKHKCRKELLCKIVADENHILKTTNYRIFLIDNER